MWTVAVARRTAEWPFVSFPLLSFLLVSFRSVSLLSVSLGSDPFRFVSSRCVLVRFGSFWLFRCAWSGVWLGYGYFRVIPSPNDL